jgi:ferredoxin/flavodoxin---NADP+ reductase
MSVPDRAAACRITWRRDWAPHLFSFRTTRPADLVFVPGQFVRLGVPGADGTMVWRAYSIASAPADEELEFYSIVVPDGPFTQPLARLGVGATIHVDPTVYGFLRTDRFTGGKTLWLLASGTGIAPIRAILADPAAWGRFADIVVVHSVRQEGELAYRDDIERWVKTPPAPGGRLHYLPTLTGQTGPLAHGRIPALVANGALEATIGLPIDGETARLMIVGNPSMIKETRALLNARGLAPVRRETPGHYIIENFW